MTFLKKHWQATAIVVIAALLTIFGWRMFSQSAQIIDLGIFMLLGTAFLLMPIAGLAEQILRKLGEQTATAPPRERTHRQELELAMAHGMGALVANPSYAGKLVGSNIREALDAMELQAASAVSCKGAYCGATDGRHSRECIAEAGATQGWIPTDADYASCSPSRVTPADIEAEIAREHYFTAEQGAKHPDADAKPYDFGDVWKSSNLGALTFCVLVLKNGTKVVGINYGAIDPAQHDAARGRQEARAQAVEKVWELLGFRLRDKLAAGA
ncbi:MULTISPECIES: Gp49 family protein [unclassified Delftia]|uniref:Gp49 family protein n=1 Tax=unclassified Delftia TaxID=2613839 RepID=UPI0018FFA42F|nr:MULTISPECIES: Gp49 family protein [unclassified Delftia]MBK0111044.1 hypothetical protein [Delftia sp. S65]MBK0119481.1 hypothetical protein [Delftia sp. S67]MBK0130215.1 hypothetical protein [Delftia sp. S66]